MVDIKVIKKLRDRMAKLAADAYHGDPEVYCPVCHKAIKEEDAKDVEYVKTKRSTELLVHTKCAPKWGET